MMVIIEEVPSFLCGAPAKLVAIDVETGKFGVAEFVQRPDRTEKTLEFDGDAIDPGVAVVLAEDIVGGSPWALTDPRALKRLALGFLAVMHKCGELASVIEGLEAEVAALEQQGKEEGAAS